ncbi:Uma2 family endonuclease [Streptomyces sp. ASQP_92]|uniref:Uma2 family endonuclease n=1 Tax=Streptomyces sp. ASQP_92 TaxID=2979116 RepID=UPI0021C15E56|nr:Uma2 family endonuclease [Streptomyces sp. ASQP_92]MCT9093000.1 Uma2 family endonuclease [Streptomyces sp. ASQP_92]
MTAVDDRIRMADQSDELTLDLMFELIEHMRVPEGYKVEVVKGAIYMSPQRDVHWDITANLLEQLRARYPRRRLKSDVRIDFPGHLNGFATDVTALAGDAEKNDKGLWRYQDIECVAEVISRSTAANDYGPKKEAYATAGVPVYLIVDPYAGEWHLHTLPKDGKYRSELTLDFGAPIDLEGTVVGLVLRTDDFARD